MRLMTRPGQRSDKLDSDARAQAPARSNDAAARRHATAARPDGGDAARDGEAGRRPSLAVVVLNYRTANLTIDCLEALSVEFADSASCPGWGESEAAREGELAGEGGRAGEREVDVDGDGESEAEGERKNERGGARGGVGGVGGVGGGVGGGGASAGAVGTGVSSGLSVGEAQVVVVDNCSGDGSAQAIESAIGSRGWSRWARVERSPVNGGFSAGNNVGMGAVDAEHYLLLNSDTLVRPGALRRLLEAAADDPQAGLIGPRLEWPNGEPQVSAFRFRRPMGEFVHAAATGPLTRLLQRYQVSASGQSPPDAPCSCDWVSFACVLIRRRTLETVGPMDEGYFMYFEDMDFCRRARRRGWKIVHRPEARVVHLRGGTSPVKAGSATRRRLPRYYYASRSRYFAKFYGRSGLWLTNLLWLAGRGVLAMRRPLGTRSHLPARSSLDIWTNARRPLRTSEPTDSNKPDPASPSNHPTLDHVNTDASGAGGETARPETDRPETARRETARPDAARNACP